MAIICIAPEQLIAGDLVAYNEGAAETAVVYHILHCPYCQQEAAALKAVDLLLKNQLYRERCPAPEILLRYVHDWLDEETKTAVFAHLAICPHCPQELQMIASAPTSSDPTNTHPFEKFHFRHIEATRHFQQLGLHMRGQQEQGQIYRAGDYQLLLGFREPDLFDVGYILEGQLINPKRYQPVSEGTIGLQNRESDIRKAELDSFGYFEFDALAAGTYILNVELLTPKIAFIIEISLP